MLTENAWAVTFDTDFVPQFVLDYALDMAHACHIPVTVFCTSLYTREQSPLLEWALHPNYLIGSTHGTTETECLAHVHRLYPQAAGHRSHCYYWHSAIRPLLTSYGLSYDSSLLLPFQPHLRPNRCWELVRFPVWCGDNILMETFPNAQGFAPPNLHKPGMKVLNFHPIHIYMNSRNLAETRAALSRLRLPEATEEDLAPLRRAGAGMGKVFEDVLRQLHGRDDVFLLRSLL